MDLTTNTELTTITLVMSCDKPLEANDVYEALKQYIEEFKEETVQ